MILDDTSRVRVVQAVPGSGKTWLIAREVGQRLATWKYRHRGIAALSFTNVARNEIQQALGFVPGHPHFVGTLDAFIFRYIVRPFAHLHQPAMRQVKLIPADYAAALADKQKWLPNSSLDVQVGPDRRTRVNIFMANFLEEVDGAPVFVGKTAPWKSFDRISARYARPLLNRKNLLWRKSGCVSHSDTTYLAREILRGPSGRKVLRLLARRFPLFVVDELQDTGWYMGQVLQQILKSLFFKALLVGDPDQAIFEFGGATPALFSTFSNLQGAKRLSMHYSRRCPVAVRAVAEQLASEARRITGPDRHGYAILATYSDCGLEELESFCSRCRDNGFHPVVLMRKNSEIEQLAPGMADPRTKFGSRPLQHLHEAVRHLRAGRHRKALALADSAVSAAAFKANHLDDCALRANGVDPFEWRCAIISLVQEAHREREGEDRYAWGLRQKTNLTRLLLENNWPAAQTVRAPNQRLKGRPVWAGCTGSSRRALICSTIHGAKGQTHDVTVFFVASNRPADCPSANWWQEDSEERRVAYVAATRAKQAFILCVHQDVLTRLQESQPEFVQRFEVTTLRGLEPDW